MMHYLLILLIGYLLGCSNMAVYLAAAQNVDLRSGGSGNPGASNALILMGWRAGLLAGAHDIAKAVLAVLLCRLLFPAVPLAGALSGAACVVGHMFPFYMRFHGGKGFCRLSRHDARLKLALCAPAASCRLAHHACDRLRRPRDNDDRHQRPALQRMERQRDHRAAPPAPFGDHHL